MGEVKNSLEPIRHFMDLYAKVVHRSLSAAELEADDIYAFQAFERAQRAGDEELRDLALRLQAQRQALMESRAASTRLAATYKMPILARHQPAPDPAPGPGHRPAHGPEMDDASYEAIIAAAVEVTITGTFRTIDKPARWDAGAAAGNAGTVAPPADGVAVAESPFSAAAEAAITGLHNTISAPPGWDDAAAPEGAGAALPPAAGKDAMVDAIATTAEVDFMATRAPDLTVSEHESAAATAADEIAAEIARAAEADPLAGPASTESVDPAAGQGDAEASGWASPEAAGQAGAEANGWASPGAAGQAGSPAGTEASGWASPGAAGQVASPAGTEANGWANPEAAGQAVLQTGAEASGSASLQAAGQAGPLAGTETSGWASPGAAGQAGLRASSEATSEATGQPSAWTTGRTTEDTAAADTAQSGGQAAALAVGAAPPADTAGTAPQVERRSGAARLNPAQLAMATSLMRLYREHFRVPLDVGRFILDDAYGRAIIAEARTAASPALVALAGRYLDENNLPHSHRRYTGLALRV